ncbi:MAG: transporter [Planctomycetota bacterium]
MSELFAVGPTPKPCAVCGFGSSLSFVHVLSSDGLRAGRTAVGMRYEQQEIDRYSDSELLAFAGQSVAAHSYDRRMALRLGAYYGVTDTLAIGLDLPWVNNVGLREAQDSPSPDIEDNGNQTGLGDASLTAQWTFHRDEAAGRSASLYVGAKLPTGRTHETTPGGERLEPDHQLGSGSTNPLLGLAGNQQVGQAVLGASAIYELATDGTLDSNLGDILRINLGVGWSPQQVQGNSLRWTFLLEALGEWRDRAELDGATDENTGGTQLFVAPGFRATWNEDVSCYGSVSFALVEDLNGEQADTDVRFATGFAVVF